MKEKFWLVLNYVPIYNMNNYKNIVCTDLWIKNVALNLYKIS